MTRELLHRAHRNDPAVAEPGAKAAPHRSEAERLRDAAAALATLCPLCCGTMRAVARRPGERQAHAPPEGLLACSSCGFAFEA